MPSRRRPVRQSPELASAILNLKASLLAGQIEQSALFAVLLPKKTKRRDNIIAALDRAREILRDLHPGAVDPRSEAIGSGELR